jgi:sirohydrochlorin cobaltochelatase
MKCAPSIEEASMQIGCNRIRLYPLFMSDGYYVRDAIPGRLGIANGVDAQRRRIRIDAPLGLHPGLPRLLANAASRAALGDGIVPSSATLLLVAHGSATSTRSADVARRLRDAIAGECAFARLEVAFLEEPPFLPETLSACPRPVIVIGLFAGCGMHVEDDLHGAVQALGDSSVFILEQLGGYAGMIEMIAADLG